MLRALNSALFDSLPRNPQHQFMYVDVNDSYRVEWRRYIFGEGILKNVVYDNSLRVVT